VSPVKSIFSLHVDFVTAQLSHAIKLLPWIHGWIRDLVHLTS
jgi:hypothetical protein